MYTAIIIEPRRHPAMQFVLKNFLENLDERWQFIIFHGIDNKQWLRDMIDTQFIADKDRIQLNNLNVVNLSREEYSRLCTSAEFIEQIIDEKQNVKFKQIIHFCHTSHNPFTNFFRSQIFW